MQRLRVAYNFGCAALYNLPWRAGVSTHQVQCNIPTFEALLRKYTYLFLERCRKPNNIWFTLRDTITVNLTLVQCELHTGEKTVIARI